MILLFFFKIYYYFYNFLYFFQEIQEKQPHDDLSALQTVMTKMYVSTTEPNHYQQNDSTANTTLMKNLAALAQLNTNTGNNGGAIQKSPVFFGGGSGGGSAAVSPLLRNQQPPSTSSFGVQAASKPASRPAALTSTFESFSNTLDSNNVFSPLQMNNSNNVNQSSTTNNWQQMEIMPMQIRCKFGNLGQNQTQFHSPHGFCMGLNEEIVVADTYNHRIQVCIYF